MTAAGSECEGGKWEDLLKIKPTQCLRVSGLHGERGGEGRAGVRYNFSSSH